MLTHWYSLVSRARHVCSSCSEQNRALWLMFVSAMLFSVMGVFVKLATEEGMSAFQLVFCRAVFQGLIVGCVILYQQLPFFGPANIRMWVVARGCFGGLSFLCYFLTIQLLPLGDSISLSSLYPVVTLLIARFLLKEPVTSMKVLAVLMCTGGALMIAQPSFLFGHEAAAATHEEKGASSGGLGDYIWVGYLTALGGTIGGGIVFVIMRRAKEAHTVQLVWSWVCGSFTFSIILGNTISRFVWPSTRAWLCIVPMCLLGIGGHLLLNYAGRLAPAGPGALVRSSDVVFAYLWEFLIFREDVSWVTLLGAAAIMAGIALIAYAKYRQSSAHQDGIVEHQLVATSSRLALVGGEVGDLVLDADLDEDEGAVREDASRKEASTSAWRAKGIGREGGEDRSNYKSKNAPKHATHDGDIEEASIELMSVTKALDEMKDEDDLDLGE